jgi:hypothetical protein
MDQKDAHLAQTSRDEELPFKIVLCLSSGGEQTLARAASAQLAHAIFKAAIAERPESRLLLRHDQRIIADTAGK